MVTTLYDPAVNSDLAALGFLTYAQLPASPVSPSEISLSATIFTPVPNLIESNTAATFDANGVTLDTDGSVFNGIPGYSLLSFLAEDLSNPITTLSATENTGYSGFTNYTINGDIEDINIGNIGNIDDLFTLETVNSNFPELDPVDGFVLNFDLTILNESSANDRAGFSVVLVTNDPSKEIELGFKTAGSDRVFAQAVNFGEAEDSAAFSLDFSVPTTYSLTVVNDEYTLAADGTEVLSGSLRNYNFDPSTSDPPFPESANPYEVPNFLFLGDNTDQAHAQFTLGQVSISELPPAQPDPDNNDSVAEVFFSYEQSLRLENPNAPVPGQSVNGIPLAQLFDEAFYLNQNSGIEAAVNAGTLASGYAHFIQFGITEGRAPSVLYNEDYYLDNNAGVKQAVMNGQFSSGLEHFLNFGHEEMRDPSELFSQDDYLAAYPNVETAINNGAFQSAFEHYINFGINESRLPALSLYNEAFYLANNPGVAAGVSSNAFADGYEHFVKFGQKEGRKPSTLFDEDTYLGLYDGVATAVSNGSFDSGFDHYVKFGRFEGRVAV